MNDLSLQVAVREAFAKKIDQLTMLNFVYNFKWRAGGIGPRA